MIISDCKQVEYACVCERQPDPSCHVPIGAFLQLPYPLGGILSRTHLKKAQFDADMESRGPEAMTEVRNELSVSRLQECLLSDKGPPGLAVAVGRLICG